MFHVTAVTRRLFNEGGTRVAELFVGHDEQRLELRFEVPVHQRHVELKFEVGKSAQAADNCIGLLLHAELDQEAAESRYGNVGQVRDVGTYHLKPFCGGEKWTLAGAFSDGDRYAIKKPGRSRKHIDVTVSDWIERPGVNTVAQRHGPSESDNFAAGDSFCRENERRTLGARPPPCRIQSYAESATRRPQFRSSTIAGVIAGGSFTDRANSGCAETLDDSG